MTDSPRSNDPTCSASALLAMADGARDGRQHHPMAGPSDAEKYRWIRANRGNCAIVDALDKSSRDAEFDDRITAEMAMCAAGMRSYRPGSGRS